MTLPPRIRAVAGQADHPPEMVGKWFFELSLWDFTGEKRLGDTLTFGPWPDEKTAKDEMRKAGRLACESVEKGYGFEPGGKFLDMKNGGVLRSWEEN